MKRAPIESLNAWLGRVQKQANGCGSYNFFNISLLSPGKNASPHSYA